MTLYLTLRKQYFDEILNGVKKQEYREYKPYWIKRLIGKDIKTIIFRNGYKKDAPSFEIECRKIEVRRNIETPIGKGDFFVLHLGDMVKD